MTDILANLRDRAAKADAKVVRYEKLLAAARKDSEDCRTALRVVGEITGIPAYGETREAQSDASQRALDLLKIVPTKRSDASAPATLFPAYGLVHSEPDNIEAFRTAIWRLKKSKPITLDGADWVVRADDGKYWRERVGTDEDPDSDPFADYADEFASTHGGSNHHTHGFGGEDLDADIPF